mmetsp:Transcript_5502/g.9084  ORF Transcript_5502/g.9084 Transcript_5502/m.9084 type:complete len:257 (+) Transcript_5502:1670-2440(+)
MRAQKIARFGALLGRRSSMGTVDETQGKERSAFSVSTSWRDNGALGFGGRFWEVGRQKVHRFGDVTCMDNTQGGGGRKFGPIGRLLHPIQIIAQKRIIRRARIEIGMGHDGSIVKNGIAPSTASFFEPLFQLFHNQTISIRLFVKKAKCQFGRKATHQNALGLEAARIRYRLLAKRCGKGGRDRLYKGLISRINQIKTYLIRKERFLFGCLEKRRKDRGDWFRLVQELMHQDTQINLFGLQASGNDRQDIAAKGLV